jgi:hypothetical protein
MELICQLYAPATLPRGRNPATHWLGGWVGPVASRDDLEKESLPLPGFDLGSSTLFVTTVGSCDLTIQFVCVTTAWTWYWAVAVATPICVLQLKSELERILTLVISLLQSFLVSAAFWQGVTCSFRSPTYVYRLWSSLYLNVGWLQSQWNPIALLT